MPAKGYRKADPKSDRVFLRLTPDEKERWQRTSEYYGYSGLSDMLRSLAEDLNAKRVCEEIMEEIKDVKVGDGYII